MWQYRMGKSTITGSIKSTNGRMQFVRLRFRYLCGIVSLCYSRFPVIFRKSYTANYETF